MLNNLDLDFEARALGCVLSSAPLLLQSDLLIRRFLLQLPESALRVSPTVCIYSRMNVVFNVRPCVRHALANLVARGSYVRVCRDLGPMMRCRVLPIVDGAAG